MNEKHIVVGMAGNPNVGKSAIFNAFTGSRQHVGNWPGKTIERAEGIFHQGDWEIHLVDLPGTYSLAAQSPEEVVARDYILSGQPDVVVNVVDATSTAFRKYVYMHLEAPPFALSLSKCSRCPSIRSGRTVCRYFRNAVLVWNVT